MSPVLPSTAARGRLATLVGAEHGGPLAKAAQASATRRYLEGVKAYVTSGRGTRRA
jgi:hypothetical protein